MSPKTTRPARIVLLSHAFSAHPERAHKAERSRLELGESRRRRVSRLQSAVNDDKIASYRRATGCVRDVCDGGRYRVTYSQPVASPHVPTRLLCAGPKLESALERPVLLAEGRDFAREYAPRVALWIAGCHLAVTAGRRPNPNLVATVVDDDPLRVDCMATRHAMDTPPGALDSSTMALPPDVPRSDSLFSLMCQRDLRFSHSYRKSGLGRPVPAGRGQGSAGGYPKSVYILPAR
jgi:hypothetical protein